MSFFLPCLSALFVAIAFEAAIVTTKTSAGQSPDEAGPARNALGGTVKVAGKIVVVTGGAKGIGQALCDRFHREGAKKVVVADIDIGNAEVVATAVGGAAHRCDVTKEADIKHVIDDTEAKYGPIDLFCSNAGVATGFDMKKENAAGDPDDVWTFGWQLHVMAHVYAARALVPRMR